ncbi:2-hydroxymuconate tautomerase [compost metagenome]
MPNIHVEMLSGRTQQQKSELARALTQEASRILECPEDFVQVIITEIERSNWSTGGILESNR